MATYDTSNIDVSDLLEESFNGTDVNTIMQQRAVCDIMKDAIRVGKDKTPVNHNCGRMVHALGILFPNGRGHVGWPSRLESIKGVIDANRKNIMNEERLSFLKGLSTENRLSNGSVRLTTDSGLRASNVQKDFIEYRTFASTIDPAKRNTKDTTFFPARGETITIANTILKDLLGLPIEYIHSSVEGEVCVVTLKIDGFNEITIQRNIMSEDHYGSDTDYCIGNSEKNQIINSLCESDPRREIDKYILIKELGDVMQVVMALVMKKLDSSDMIDIVGTTDDVVRSLCDLFKINSIYQDHDRTMNGQHAVFYRRFEEDPEKLKRGANELLKNNIIAWNKKFMITLNNCIQRNTLLIGTENYLNDQKYRGNYRAVKNFLRKIIATIEAVNINIEEIDVNYDMDQFKRLVSDLRAIEVIDPKMKVRQVSRRLFNKGIASPIDPIFVDGRNLSMIIQKPPTEEIVEYIQLGGGMNHIPSPEDTILAESCADDEEVTHAFLLNVRSLMPDGYLKVGEGGGEGDDVIYITPHDVLAMLYNGLLYVGITPFNPNILKELISRFVITGGDYVLQDFETAYNSIDTPLSPDTIFPYSALPPNAALTDTQFTRMAYDPIEESDEFNDAVAMWDSYIEREVQEEQEEQEEQEVQGSPVEKKQGYMFETPAKPPKSNFGSNSEERVGYYGLESDMLTRSKRKRSDNMGSDTEYINEAQSGTQSGTNSFPYGDETQFGGATHKHRTLRKHNYKRNRTLKKKNRAS